ncbi:MAG: alpha/beta fold hydrolase [Candidatus Dormibacteraceae bacterium]
MTAAPRLVSERVRVGDLEIHHTRGGRGSPLLLVHGLGSSGYIEWRYNLADLARHHRVLAPDLPGFGRSDKPRTRYGVPFFARTLDAYMERLRLRSAAVVGASLGGRVAIELALQRPARVSRLVLVNSLGLGRPRVRLYYPLMMMPRVGEAVMGLVREGVRRAPLEVVRRVAARHLGARADAGHLIDEGYLADIRELHSQRGFGEAYLATVRSLARLGSAVHNRDLADRLARLDKPVMLIWGADDPLFPVEHALAAHRLIPDSRLEIVENAGHSPQAERPDDFNRLLRGFVGG